MHTSRLLTTSRLAVGRAPIARSMVSIGDYANVIAEVCLNGY